MLSLKPGESREVSAPSHPGTLEGRPEFRFSATDVASLVSDGERHVITAGRKPGRVDLLITTRWRKGDEVAELVDTIPVRIGGKPDEAAAAPALPDEAVPTEATGSDDAPAPRGRKKAAAKEDATE